MTLTHVLAPGRKLFGKSPRHARAPLSARAERRFQLALDAGERLFVLLLFAAFVASLSHTIGVRPYNVMALLSEALVAFLILTRRSATALTTRPLDWTLALAGTAMPMLARPGGEVFLPQEVGAILMFAGLALSLWAKATLRRSFGIAAAARGLVRSGPYLGVRHPMYAGYLLIYLGFLLGNPRPWNVLVYIPAAALQLARIHAEERLLADDPAYRNFMRRTRARLVPGVY